MSNETQTPIAGYSESFEPLVPGTTLLDRYTIVAFVSGSETMNLYAVAPVRPCPVCNVENEGNASECGFCGSELPEPNLLQLIERRAPSELRTLPPSSFVIDGCSYTLTPDEHHMSTQAAMPLLRFTFGMQTDPGLKRGALGEPNEDSLAAVTFAAHDARGAALGAFMIADGVGGAAAGEIASRLCLQTLTHEWVTRLLLPLWNETALSDETIRAEILAGVAAANARLLQYQSDHNLQSGATLTAALIFNGRAYVVNIGDSRTYLYRRGVFSPLTRDHSYVAALVANGVLSPEEAYLHPQRNLILRSLGDVNLDPDIFPEGDRALELEPGDRMLLCSDGLWEMVRDAEMQNVLAHTPDPQQACAELVNWANLAGGADNISSIVVNCDAGSE
ncbi:MAG: serine/threonine-protein phosphatase [Chloroflexi bacterium]|nr:serine/threonine-protein phosphatase [Chloroflexota bacterium]